MRDPRSGSHRTGGRTRQGLAVLALGALLLAVTACGDDGDDGEESGASDTSGASDVQELLGPEADEETSFVLVNPMATLFGLPIAAAESADADRIAFVNIDVPVALTAFESGAADEILDNASYETVDSTEIVEGL